MNYYIQGDAARAEEIKAAFEKLGIKASGYDFSRKDVLFFTFEAKGKTNMMSSLLGTGLDNIILTHPDYKELELPVEPKFKAGDWVVKKDGTPFYGGNYAEQITNIEDDGGLKCIWFSSGTWLRDKDIRLWTIQDAKDGDVLALNGKPFIYSHNKYGKNYCYIDDCGQFRVNFNLVLEGNCVCPATKQERDLLFSKMRKVGYEWDEKKKELRKIKPHYNIANFHAGMPVLVRDDKRKKWCYALYSHYDNEDSYQFVTAGDNPFIQCIPFEGNEHLLGTTDMPDDMYINW